MRVLTLFFVSLLATGSARSVVWQAKPGLQWTSQYVKKYQQFISEEVEGDFFKKLGGKFKELPLDCADAAYGMLIYFSYRHRLPWVSMARDRFNDKVRFDNNMTLFDHIADEHERVAHLVDFMISRGDTSSLAWRDTYPVAIRDIKPGDIYLYSYGKKKKTARHAFVIKKVNTDGTLDVLYGTQNRAKKGMPLVILKSKILQHKPFKPWGFKRFKWPRYAATAQASHPGASLGQYYLASIRSEAAFFKGVENVLQLAPPRPAQKLERLYKSLCTSLLSRAVVVKDAVLAQSTRPAGQQCFNYLEFDALSTPSRDRGIKQQYQALKNELGQVKKTFRSETAQKMPLEFSRHDIETLRKVSFVESIFSKQRTWAENDYLSRRCAINFYDSQQKRYHLHVGHFYDRLVSGQVSWHPNDNIARRWGFQKGEKTRCPSYYGE